jgi:NADPH:quinone reductase and related Zn-dependent oxidoreductases
VKSVVLNRLAPNVRDGETYAEELLVLERLAAYLPDNVAYAAAVSIVSGGQTGYNGIVRGLQVNAGQHVLSIVARSHRDPRFIHFLN